MYRETVFTIFVHPELYRDTVFTIIVHPDMDHDTVFIGVVFPCSAVARALLYPVCVGAPDTRVVSRCFLSRFIVLKCPMQKRVN